MTKAAAVLALAALLLAGCNQPPPSGWMPVDFDGQRAYDAMEGLVRQSENAGHDRVPGHPMHDARAASLLAHIQNLGGHWSAHLESFNGSQYAQLDKGAARPYAEPGPLCGDEDFQQVSGLDFHNIVADWNGLVQADAPRLLIGAHWDAKEDRDDGVAPVPAANDGASGVGVLLELARVLGDQWPPGTQLPFHVRIVLFDGEDGFEDCHPLAGSLWHAHELAPGEVDAMILLDMVGDDDARFVIEGRSDLSAPDLRALLWQHADRLGDDRFTTTRCTVLDDHVPFIEQGIPSVDIIDFGRGGLCRFPPYWHTAEDTPDKLSADALDSTGEVLLSTLRDPAMAAWLEQVDQ